MKGQLSVAWGQFLSEFSWDWFVSLTFREDVKSFRAHRLFGFFVRDLEQAARIPIFWFRADEIGPLGGRFHLHALVGNVAHMRRMSWVDRWDKLAGFGRILPFNERKGAAYYCAKYVTKQNGDWELSNNLLAFRQNQPMLPLSGATKLGSMRHTTHENEERLPSRKKHVKNVGQYPLIYDSRSEAAASNEVLEVYKTEVTRGKWRFRQF
jgi:hypothetical protein